ncbi:MAG: hypothetical protein R6U92_01105 [Bacillota bacterium]
MSATTFVLTPAESKRLIAKAVVQLDPVSHALSEGIVVVSTGSTNTFVLEEILGESVPKHRYLSGMVLPEKNTPDIPRDRRNDLIMVRGNPDDTLDRFSVLEHMEPGDVFIKGANALNYDTAVAGVLIGGHGGGGTIGATIGHIVGRRLNFIIPVGLEKCVAEDIHEIADRLNTPDEYDPDPPRMMPVTGQIITEIEALRLLAGVEVYHMASGGIGGAEGAVWLLAEGSPEDVRRARSVVEAVQGEPPFLAELGR